MKKIIVIIGLTLGLAANTVTCIDYGNGMKVCTDDQGNTTTIMTY